MSTAQVLRVPTGSIASERVQVRTLTNTFGQTVVDLGTEGTTSVRAAERVDVVAPTVTVPSATFTDSGATLTGQLTVEGPSELASLEAATMASQSVSTPLLTVSDPDTQDLEIVAREVTVRGDLVVDGALGTTDPLLVRSAVLVLGADAATLTDTTRDSAGIVVPGAPENLPADRSAEDYEHSIRWKRNEGDFAADSAPMAPHQRPRWTFSGGCVSISAGDASECFIAPHRDPATGAASLGIYYQVAAGEPVLVQRFLSDTRGGREEV